MKNLLDRLNKCILHHIETISLLIVIFIGFLGGLGLSLILIAITSILHVLYGGIY